jgi:hypothetical protein
MNIMTTTTITNSANQIVYWYTSYQQTKIQNKWPNFSRKTDLSSRFLSQILTTNHCHFATTNKIHRPIFCLRNSRIIAFFLSLSMKSFDMFAPSLIPALAGGVFWTLTDEFGTIVPTFLDGDFWALMVEAGFVIPRLLIGELCTFMAEFGVYGAVNPVLTPEMLATALSAFFVGGLPRLLQQFGVSADAPRAWRRAVSNHLLTWEYMYWC